MKLFLKIFVFTLSLSGLFTNCGHADKQAPESDDSVIYVSITQEKLSKTETRDLDKVATDIIYNPLETTKDCPISRLDNVFIVGDNLHAGFLQNRCMCRYIFDHQLIFNMK